MLTATLLLGLLRPVTQHVPAACAGMLDRSGGPVTVCMDRRVVVRWEVRR